MSKIPSDSFDTELLRLFPIWRHDGLDPLTSIIGYATLLLENKVENLTEQQKQFITIIRNIAKRAATSWHSPGDYITLRFDFENSHWKWEAIQLSEICDSILSSSFKHISKSNVQVAISDNLPLIKADGNWLSIAITYLLEPSTGYLYNPDFNSSIFAQQSDDNHVVVRVRTGLKLSLDEGNNSIESISSPGNNLSVANIILDKHESRLEFRRLNGNADKHESQGTEFEFTLPIWQ